MCVGHGSDKGNDMFFLENQGNVFFLKGPKIFGRGVGVMLSITMETRLCSYKIFYTLLSLTFLWFRLTFFSYYILYFIFI